MLTGKKRAPTVFMFDIAKYIFEISSVIFQTTNCKHGTDTVQEWFEIPYKDIIDYISTYTIHQGLQISKCFFL